jgi:hypothetical protein
MKLKIKSTKMQFAYLIAFGLSILVIGYLLKRLFLKEMFEDVKIVPSCPSGSKQFTDKPGNNACCSGKINYEENTCNGTVCTLSDKVENPNKPGMFYDKCKT